MSKMKNLQRHRPLEKASIKYFMSKVYPITEVSMDTLFMNVEFSSDEVLTFV